MMKFDVDEFFVIAMFDQGDRCNTMIAIDAIIPFVLEDIDMVEVISATLMKLFLVSDECYSLLEPELEDYKKMMEEE
jgi:hypothetical protein